MGAVTARRLVAIALFGSAIAGCSAPAPDSPEAVVEGALRSSVEAVTAPREYRSGPLPSAIATAWIARAEADYGRWYRGPVLDQHLLGLHNVVSALMASPGPIPTSVDVQRIETGPVVVNGDTAHVQQASIWYVTHYAPGTWSEADVSGVTMCRYDLRLTAGVWRIETDTCNVSGG